MLEGHIPLDLVLIFPYTNKTKKIIRQRLANANAQRSEVLKTTMKTLFLSLTTLLFACSVKPTTLPSRMIDTKCFPLPAPKGSTYYNCFGGNLKTSSEDVGYEWPFEDDESNYHAYTSIRSIDSTSVYAVTFHRERIPAGVVPHEISHVAEYLELNGESRSQFIDFYTNITYTQILENDYEL